MYIILALGIYWPPPRWNLRMTLKRRKKQRSQRKKLHEWLLLPSQHTFKVVRKRHFLIHVCTSEQHFWTYPPPPVFEISAFSVNWRSYPSFKKYPFSPSVPPVWSLGNHRWGPHLRNIIHDNIDNDWKSWTLNQFITIHITKHWSHLNNNYSPENMFRLDGTYKGITSFLMLLLRQHRW